MITNATHDSSMTLDQTSPKTSSALTVQLSFKRYEIKYLISDAQRERLMAVMASHMVPDEYGPSTVCNIYYDTPSNLLVRRSIEGGTYKEKVRTRSYGVAHPGDPVFLELKKKAEGIVYKRRATLSPERAEALLAGHGDPTTQIERELDFSIRRYGGLLPMTFLAYDREAFYAADDHDFRMTFDRRLRYRTHDVSLTADDHGDLLMREDQSILEVKTAKAIPLWLVQFLSAEGLRKVSFSKIGRAYQRECELAARRLPAPAAAVEPASVPERVPVSVPAYTPRHLEPIHGWRTAVA